jgi:hypothetical protein
MDLQHEDVRELDRVVSDLLSDPPKLQTRAGWMNYADRASSCVTASSTTSWTMKINSSGSRTSI